MVTKYIGNALPFNQEQSQITRATVEEALLELAGEPVLGLDIETTRKFPKGQYDERVYRGGLDPWLTSIVMLQIGTLEVNYVIDARVVDLKLFKPLLESDTLFVGANLKFETKHLLHSFGIRLRNIWDVMLVEMNLYNGAKRSYSLLNIAKTYFDITDVGQVDLFSLDTFNAKKKNWEEDVWDAQEQFIIDKSTRLQFINIGDRPFTKAQILYGVDDIVLPLKIRVEQMKGRNLGAETYNPKYLHILENKVCTALAQVELNGIPFDRDKLLKLDAENKQVYTRRLAKLNEYVEANHPQYCTPSLFGNGFCNISWTSPKQVIPLFESLEVCAWERSKSTGEVSQTVGSKGLLKIVDKDYRLLYDNRAYNGVENTPIVNPQDLVIHYLLFKESQQLVKTFGEEYTKYIHPITKRVHPNFYQILSTGRLSSSKPNMMQWPGVKRYREVICTDNKFITEDYSAQEIRILAEVSQVEDMKNFFIKGDDIFGSDFHSFTASRVARLQQDDPTIVITKKSDPEARGRAKITNFSINYGAGPPNLAAQFGSTIEEAEVFQTQYMDSWEGLQENFDDRKNKALKQGFIILDKVIDRRWFSPDFEEMQQLQKKASAYYPDNYRYWNKLEREEFKTDLYNRKPEVKMYWKKYMGMKGALERKALNYPIQSTAGSMTKLSLVYTTDEIYDNGWENDVWVVNLVHDETNAESFAHHERNAEMISRNMVRAGKVFCPEVPMEVEYEVSTYWSK